MSRKPDYEKMKLMIAQKVAKKLDHEDIIDTLMYGHIGYERETDNDILSLFLEHFKTHEIPKVKNTR